MIFNYILTTTRRKVGSIVGALCGEDGALSRDSLFKPCKPLATARTRFYLSSLKWDTSVKDRSSGAQPNSNSDTTTTYLSLILSLETCLQNTTPRPSPRGWVCFSCTDDIESAETRLLLLYHPTEEQGILCLFTVYIILNETWEMTAHIYWTDLEIQDKTYLQIQRICSLMSY